MSTDNRTIMNSSRDALRGKWGFAIGTYLVYSIVLSAFGTFREGGIIGLLIAGPLMLGAATISIALARGQEARFEELFEGFRYFGNALATYLLMLLYIILWLLLLIVPGIIAALSYSMTFYIFAEDKSLKPGELLEKSKKMMDGYKMKLFNLYLRFLLLALLCILTLGIGFLWLIPYVHVTVAKFYDDIKVRAI